MKYLLGAITFTIHEQARVVNIVVGKHSTDEDGRTCLTSELMTEDEIDINVQFLKNDLDEAGRLAKQALKRARSKPVKLFD